MCDSDYGTPFGAGSSDPVDDWSRAVFEAYRDWPLARSGRWFRSQDGCLRLLIEQVESEKLEPLFAIELDTFDGQINLDFGSWCTPVSPLGGSLGEASANALAEARELVEGWLRGDVQLASYSDEAGWRGSKLIYGGELPAALEPVPAAIGEQGKVVVKTPRRCDWRSWRHIGDGIWIECEIGEG
ncbi:MAG TPA: hypothetical protein VGC46_00655 [Allosphingosinicella sp.]